MLTHYNPEHSPDPQAWLALDEAERMELVRRFHRRARVKLPNERLHTIVHVIVENQAAMGEETPVASTLQRLMSEGLSRHEAAHAVGSVFARHMWELEAGKRAEDADPHAAYFQEVRELTAQQWLSSS